MRKRRAPVVAAIILNWNGRDHLLRCLRSIEGLDYPKKCLQLIIVDNGSADGSQRTVREFLKRKGRRYLKALLIELPRNIGAPAAMNKGLEALHASAEYVWKLDNDVLFGPDYLAILIQLLSSEQDVGAIGGRLVDEGGRDQPSHAVLRKPPRRWTGILEYHVVDPNEVCDTDVILGCSCLFRKEVFRSHGTFRECFFLYYDDTEFCLRLRKYGWRLIISPAAEATHLGYSSVGKGSRVRLHYMTRNKILLGRAIFSGPSKAMFILIQIVALPWYLLRTSLEYSGLPVLIVIEGFVSSFVQGLIEPITDE